jgi:hypothetical protein
MICPCITFFHCKVYDVNLCHKSGGCHVTCGICGKDSCDNCCPLLSRCDVCDERLCEGCVANMASSAVKNFYSMDPPTVCVVCQGSGVSTKRRRVY